MRDPDSFDLDVLLRAATVQRDPAAEKRLFSDVWSRVQASIGDGAASSLDAAQQRRLNVIGDREVAARRRRRAARLASAALAVAVAGGGRRWRRSSSRPGPARSSPGGRSKRGVRRGPRSGRHRPGYLVGQIPDGPLFLLLAPQALAQEQVLEIAEQVTYTP